MLTPYAEQKSRHHEIRDALSALKRGYCHRAQNEAIGRLLEASNDHTTASFKGDAVRMTRYGQELATAKELARDAGISQAHVDEFADLGRQMAENTGRSR